MPALLGGLILLVFGIGVLAVAWQGYRRGELPAGSNFLNGSYKPTREDSPLAFHVFLALYLCGGIALAAWGLLMVFGVAAPLKLR
jgi:hypothetical protein